MSEFLFPDNTVLCNFAAVDRLDILRAALDGRGRWTAAVANEAQNSARWIPALSSLERHGWLGEAIRITTAEDIEKIFDERSAVFGGNPERLLQHLGEAETLYIIKNWDDFSGSWWISDDRESLRYAQRQGITTAETVDMVRLAVGDGHIAAQDGFDLMKQMWDVNRRPRLPDSVTDLKP
ncbi:hypothetical protein KEF29_33315 [Streptomyces tuirus]|uniref:Uncharacterized protein n=1 Tax=Streptomyces tuirus TaxID=68278 RepID=A0A941J899_9ACTN|nr:hypothetical protein [Streptomyces tuirus]